MPTNRKPSRSKESTCLSAKTKARPLSAGREAVRFIEKSGIPCWLKCALVDALDRAGKLHNYEVIRGNTLDSKTVDKLFFIVGDLMRLPEPEPVNTTPEKPARKGKSKLRKLKDQLGWLEEAPENEATRFQLETQIARIEREDSQEEWPEVLE